MILKNIHLLNILQYQLFNVNYLCTNKYIHNNNKKIEKYIYKIKQQFQIGFRVDNFFKKISHLNWLYVQKQFRIGTIKIQTNSGEIIKLPNYILTKGDKIIMTKSIYSQFIHNQTYFTQKYQQSKSKIITEINSNQAKILIQSMTIFSNENIIILNKHAGYSVQGGKQNNRNIFSLLIAAMNSNNIHTIHRLDKPTTGILLMGKNKKTAQLIQQMIEHKQYINKFYLAYTIGPQINKIEDYIEVNLKYTNRNNVVINSNMNNNQNNNKYSLTFYRILNKTIINSTKFKHLIGIKLLTGRKHQIRCHLAKYLSNAILNDGKYFGERRNHMQSDAIYLHAFSCYIQNQQIIKKVFEKEIFNLEKQIVCNNQNGSVEIENGRMIILAKLPKYWLDQDENNKNICLKYISEEIENRHKQCKLKNVSYKTNIKIK